MIERNKMDTKKMWALLEIHHDSDKGPNDVDFEHTITLCNTEDDAIKARTLARRRVIGLPLAETNNIEVDNGDMVVFASDDWWKWEIYEIEYKSPVPAPGKKTFIVHHQWTVQKDYEIEADSKEEALRKLRTKINAGEVCVWTDGYEATDKEMAWVPGDEEAANEQD